MKKFLFAISFLLLQSTFVSAGTCLDLKYPLIRGQEMNEVLLLQNFLTEKGYLTATPNGYFGPATFSAVKKYQRSVLLPASGNVLVLTRAAIKKETCLENEITVPVIKETYFLATSTPEVAIAPTTIEVSLNDNSFTFGQNMRYVKLATFKITSREQLTLNSLSLYSTSTTVASGTIFNFTVTDINADRIINGGPLFTFSNQKITPGEIKIFELYANIGTFPNATSSLIFNGNIGLSDSRGASSTVAIKDFTINLAK